MQKIEKIFVITGTGEDIKEEIVPVPVPFIRTHYNSRSYIKHPEINNEPSKTIPDQAMTVMEIYRRFASGLPLSGQRVPMYDGEEETPDFNKLDLSEREAIIRETRQEIQEIEKRVADRKMKAKEVQLQKLVDKRVAEKLAAQKGGGDEPA